MVEIETAKAAVELPSPFAGRVHALLVEPGVTVEVGTPIITIDTDRTPASARRRVGSRPAGAPRRDTGSARRSARWPRTAGSPPWSATCRRGRHRRPAAAARGPGPARWPPSSRRGNGDRPAGRRSRAAAAPLAAPPVRKLAKDLGVDLRSVHASRGGRRDQPGGRRDDAAAANDSRRRPRPVPAERRRRPRAPDPGQGDPQGHRGRDGGQRVHRAARHRVPDRRRDPDDGAAGPAARPAGIRRRSSSTPAGLRRPRGLPGGPADPGDQRGVRDRRRRAGPDRGQAVRATSASPPPPRAG